MEDVFKIFEDLIKKAVDSVLEKFGDELPRMGAN